MASSRDIIDIFVISELLSIISRNPWQRAATPPLVNVEDGFNWCGLTFWGKLMVVEFLVYLNIFHPTFGPYQHTRFKLILV